MNSLYPPLNSVILTFLNIFCIKLISLIVTFLSIYWRLTWISMSDFTLSISISLRHLVLRSIVATIAECSPLRMNLEGTEYSKRGSFELLLVSIDEKIEFKYENSSLWSKIIINMKRQWINKSATNLQPKLVLMNESLVVSKV